MWKKLYFIEVLFKIGLKSVYPKLFIPITSSIAKSLLAGFHTLLPNTERHFDTLFTKISTFVKDERFPCHYLHL